MPNTDIDNQVKAFFEEKITTFGSVPRGLDYPSLERQQICFDQLTKIWRDPSEAASLLDYGCGYGALIEYLEEHQFQVTHYQGYDLAPGMVKAAQQQYGHRANCSFTTDKNQLTGADYVIAGGVFNMKLETSNDDWLPYILEQMDSLWNLSARGFAFNILTSYSDAEKMRPDLYYADPGYLFDYCKRHYSRNVALLHDYDFYEFTVLVRR
jgi:SAM-dependent methyltransferase